MFWRNRSGQALLGHLIYLVAKKKKSFKFLLFYVFDLLCAKKENLTCLTYILKQIEVKSVTENTELPPPPPLSSK